MVTADAAFWRGRRVLVTGHTGFKGSWLRLWLERLGADVTGLALPPLTEPSLYQIVGWSDPPTWTGNVTDEQAVSRAFGTEPELVVHLAAQSSVPRAQEDPVGTFATNVTGTSNILEAARTHDAVMAVLVVTSDKVYMPSPDGTPVDETSDLDGDEPYAASKACAELVVRAYRSSLLRGRDLMVATARAGNVIGGGDWADDRLVPDVLRAFRAGRPVGLRRPDAIRPWQHVLDVLHGYLMYARVLLEHADGAPMALNFGPGPEADCRVSELVNLLTDRLGGRPGWRRETGPQRWVETEELRLRADRARAMLGWRPRLDLARIVEWTVEWHRAHLEHNDMRAWSLGQIAAFESLG